MNKGYISIVSCPGVEGAVYVAPCAQCWQSHERLLESINPALWGAGNTLHFEVLIDEQVLFYQGLIRCLARFERPGLTGFFDISPQVAIRHVLTHVVDQHEGTVRDKITENDHRFIASLAHTVPPEKLATHVATHLCSQVKIRKGTRTPEQTIHWFAQLIYGALIHPDHVKNSPLHFVVEDEKRILHYYDDVAEVTPPVDLVVH